MAPYLQEVLLKAVGESGSPGAVAYVGDMDGARFCGVTGRRQVEPVVEPAERSTLYDLASLTKVVATTTAVMLLYEDGLIDLDGPASDYVPIPSFRAFTIRQLLTHTAGWVAVRPYYAEASSLNQMLQLYANLGLAYQPGTARIYSDVSFLILGKVVELAAQDSLDGFCRRRIFAPLGMDDTCFNPPPAWSDRCAATENCTWRREMVKGKVHDENAYAVGGVAGHAGLFSTAEDLARFCRALLSGKLLEEKTMDQMLKAGQAPSYPWQGLGWQLDPFVSAPDGFLPARTAFGHSGWTGTSLWADRRTGLFAVLLSNTCHPSRNTRDNRELRSRFYTGVAETFYPRSSNTHTGLDVLVHESFRSVAGRRIALLTNHAAVDALGRPILEVLKQAPGMRVKVVYSPEHGLMGQAEAGEAVSSSVWESTPVVSLYGARNAPTQEELKDIELFVIDLQDVGSRYFTYVATMKACLIACGKARKPVLILDRPNPVGGVVLEGPIAEKTDSPVCCAPVPIRHGMTMCEMALFLVKFVLPAPRPQVMCLPMDSWRRDLYFEECELPWIPPSPNMPTPHTALVYVGTCLFEGTNLNEGRGTDRPFQLIGAPWLDAAGIVRGLDPQATCGFEVEPTCFTPRSLVGKASSPRYQDQPCKGVGIGVTDLREARPFTLAVALLKGIRDRHPQEFSWNASFDVLAGGPDLRRRIEKGQSALEIAAAYAKPLETFDGKRPKRYA
jgi:uncharacterized protein YbbC (DUF1343 family)/CubicO group peptidase (beta-lactamase class C family)